MNTDLRKKAKNDFEKYFFKLINNAVFVKIMGNVRKHRDIKLVTTERRRIYLVSEPNYYTTEFFTENLLEIEMKKKTKKTDILKNKPVYLRLSIYEFWNHYVKLKYGVKAKLCYMDIDSFLLYIKAYDIYKDIEVDIETRFDSSDYELVKPLPKGER